MLEIDGFVRTVGLEEHGREPPIDAAECFELQETVGGIDAGILDLGASLFEEGFGKRLMRVTFASRRDLIFVVQEPAHAGTRMK